MQKIKYVFVPTVCLVLVVLAIILNGGAKATGPTTLARSSRIDGLVNVKVHGTQADITPDFVYVIVENPKLERNAAIDVGASAWCKNESDVRFGRVIYGFSIPENWKNLRGFQLQAGDVIYTFNVESTEERTRLLKRAKLTKKAGVLQFDDSSESQIMFASKGYYVIVATPLTTYDCLVHPEISKAKPGKCPECGIELFELEHYR